MNIHKNEWLVIANQIWTCNGIWTRQALTEHSVDVDSICGEVREENVEVQWFV